MRLQTYQIFFLVVCTLFSFIYFLILWLEEGTHWADICVLLKTQKMTFVLTYATTEFEFASVQSGYLSCSVHILHRWRSVVFVSVSVAFSASTFPWTVSFSRYHPTGCVCKKISTCSFVFYNKIVYIINKFSDNILISSLLRLRYPEHSLLWSLIFCANWPGFCTIKENLKHQDL